MPILKIKISALFVLLTLVMTAFASTKVKVSEYQLLKDTTKKYQVSGLVEMSVEKIVKSELMGSETTYSGKINISSGLFRWENSTPEKTLLVFDGNTIWNEQSPPADFPGPVQVVKAKVDKKNRSQILLSSLLGKASIFENFKVLKEEKKDAEAQYLIEPKIKDLNINQLTLTVDTHEKTLVGVSYKDEVGNLTAMKFSKIEFHKKNKNKKLFKYVPPEGAQVTNL